MKYVLPYELMNSTPKFQFSQPTTQLLTDALLAIYHRRLECFHRIFHHQLWNCMVEPPPPLHLEQAGLPTFITQNGVEKTFKPRNKKTLIYKFTLNTIPVSRNECYRFNIRSNRVNCIVIGRPFDALPVVRSSIPRRHLFIYLFSLFNYCSSAIYISVWLQNIQ